MSLPTKAPLLRLLLLMLCLLALIFFGMDEPRFYYQEF